MITPRRQLRLTFFAKRLVANRDHLVNQINLEINRHTQSKRETCPHATRIGAQRHIEIVAEFGELADVLSDLCRVETIYPRHEPHVLFAGEVVMKSACESNRPGNPHMAHDLSAIR